MVFISNEIINNHSNVTRLCDQKIMAQSPKKFGTAVLQNTNHFTHAQTNLAIYLTNYLNNSIMLQFPCSLNKNHNSAKITILEDIRKLKNFGILDERIRNPFLPNISSWWPPPSPWKIIFFRGITRGHWKETEFSECSSHK